MNKPLTDAVVVQPPASVASTATTTAMFDCRGYDYLLVDVLSGTQATTDPAITTVTFKEADNTSATSFSSIVAFTGAAATSTTAGFVIPAVTVTGFGAVLQFQMDLRRRKRYIQLNMTPGTTLVLAAIAKLQRAEVAALTAAQKSITNTGASNATGCALVVNG